MPTIATSGGGGATTTLMTTTLLTTMLLRNGLMTLILMVSSRGLSSSMTTMTTTASMMDPSLSPTQDPSYGSNPAFLSSQLPSIGVPNGDAPAMVLDDRIQRIVLTGEETSNLKPEEVFRSVVVGSDSSDSSAGDNIKLVGRSKHAKGDEVYSSSGSSNRNTLVDRIGKGHQHNKQRTTSGGKFSEPDSIPPEERNDSDNPLHATDLEVTALVNIVDPSTSQQQQQHHHQQQQLPSITGTGESTDETNDDDDRGSRTSSISSSSSGSWSVPTMSNNNISSPRTMATTTAEPPASVPTPQHHQQAQPSVAVASSPPPQQQHQQQQQQKHRTINSMNLNPTTPAMLVKPVDEHRKLLKSTGPILNYVFDSHPPYYKSSYYNTRYGPHFETDNVTNITVQNGDDLFLSCRISLLLDKTVSWVLRKHGETDLQLLTVGKQTYSGDPRYTVEFQYPNNWRLKIAAVNKNDEGVYECQISTHPPKVIIYYLHVNAPEVLIVDEEGQALYDKYYEVGSTIKLLCRIRHMSMLRSAVYWIHNEAILNHDVQRGGISVKTNLTNIGANSTLFVAKVNRQDSGNYTCSIGPNQHYSVSVHVLNGTANPYGIYQRSCAFSALLGPGTLELKCLLKQLLFLLLLRRLATR
ncbi:uncharacterized protein LOC129742128 [Uranotaenia lowii]|uniref:uncharacterized protein LOC129742128 n=1 Tax=Uranotaenia lowii TaxID=190385 RepID=UPI00247AB727|nr:uncharacterized protein LOC129742128 [Uranotaenia lowii]